MAQYNPDIISIFENVDDIEFPTSKLSENSEMFDDEADWDDDDDDDDDD